MWGKMIAVSVVVPVSLVQISSTVPSLGTRAQREEPAAACCGWMIWSPSKVLSLHMEADTVAQDNISIIPAQLRSIRLRSITKAILKESCLCGFVCVC